MQTLFLSLMIFITSLSLGCSNSAKTDKESEKKEAKATLITVTQVKKAPLEITESAVGSLESLSDPTVAAEMAARVVSINVNVGDRVTQGQLIATLDATDFAMQRDEAQAEVARIQAQLENQQKIVARNQALVNKKFISQNAVDNDISQQNVLKEQLKGAQSRVGSINHNASKTKIVAPISGIVQKRPVGKGDYVKTGDPLVQIISSQHLRAHLPFPEQMSAKLKAGLTVRLTTPTSSKTVETIIHELKPMITEGSQTVDVIADIFNEPEFQAGATVNGTVVLGVENAAVMIPEQSLVLRPAGEVVYVVLNKIAYQRIVKTGLRQNGLIEILEGLQADDQIVVDGAGFLTDKTPVTISH